MTISTCSKLEEANPVLERECSAINKSCNQIVLVSSRLIDLDHQRFCVAQAGEGGRGRCVEEKEQKTDAHLIEIRKKTVARQDNKQR
jgi:hypothetical protein